MISIEKIGKYSVLLGLPAVLAGAVVAWKTVGWMTPSGHEESLHEHQDATLSAIKAVSVKLDTNQAQWLCDENEEELVDLLKEQAIHETVERQVKIDSVRAKLTKLDCTRFED